MKPAEKEQIQGLLRSLEVVMFNGTKGRVRSLVYGMYLRNIRDEKVAEECNRTLAQIDALVFEDVKGGS